MDDLHSSIYIYSIELGERFIRFSNCDAVSGKIHLPRRKQICDNFYIS